MVNYKRIAISVNVRNLADFNLLPIESASYADNDDTNVSLISLLSSINTKNKTEFKIIKPFFLFTSIATP